MAAEELVWLLSLVAQVIKLSILEVKISKLEVLMGISVLIEAILLGY
jgi:hypothetical protein